MKRGFASNQGLLTMAAGEVTGRDETGLKEKRAEYEETPLAEHGIPFDVAYCLTAIGKQPDEYDGEQRYCSRRAAKLTESEWDEKYDDEYDKRDPRSYCYTCKFHGRISGGHEESLKSYTAAIKHGLEAEDEHLRMDFSDAEQTLYDGIVEQWPEAYDWPDEDEDPARYLLLRKVATNVVRSNRAEDYLDEQGEVRITDRISDEGIVVEPDGQHDENPIAGEYRLLVREITSMLKELGLTPKEQAKQGAAAQSANALADIGMAVNDAVVGGEKEYEPDQFDGEGDAGDA